MLSPVLDGEKKMDEQFMRSSLVLGEAAIERLSECTVAVFGTGGVGSFVAEALGRMGVGHLVLIDNDVVDITNLNRQLVALHSTIGKYKADVMRDRLLDINPNADVKAVKEFYEPGLAGRFFEADYDYIVDAIDYVPGKVSLAEEAYRRGIPSISSMGAGNKLDPTRLQVADIYSTSVCPLARVMRKKLRERGIPNLKVVYSTEKPVHNDAGVPGSVAFVPSVAGLIIAGEVVHGLVGSL